MKKVVNFVVFSVIFAMALVMAFVNAFLGVGYAEETSNATVAPTPRILTATRVTVLQAPYTGAEPLWVIEARNELNPIGSVNVEDTRWEAVMLPTGKIGYVEESNLLYNPMAAIIYSGVPIWATPEKKIQIAVSDGSLYQVAGSMDGCFVVHVAGGVGFVDTEQVEGLEPMPASAPASAPYTQAPASATPVPALTAVPAVEEEEEEYFFPPQMQEEPVFTFEDQAPAYQAYPASAPTATQAPVPAYQQVPAQAQAYQPAQATTAYPAYQAPATQAAPTQLYQPAQPAPIYVGGSVELHGVEVFSRADFAVSLGYADGYYQVLAMENGYLVISFPFGGEQVLGFVPTSALLGR